MNSLLFRPGGNSLDVGDVEHVDGDLVGAMLSKKGVEAILTTADRDDKDSRANHALGEGFSNTGGGARDEHSLIREGHDEKDTTTGQESVHFVWYDLGLSW